MKQLTRNIFWAGKGFVYRGVWMWTGKRNIRIVPLNRFDNPFGIDKEAA